MIVLMSVEDDEMMITHAQLMADPPARLPEAVLRHLESPLIQPGGTAGGSR